MGAGRTVTEKPEHRPRARLTSRGKISAQCFSRPGPTSIWELLEMQVLRPPLGLLNLELWNSDWGFTGACHRGLNILPSPGCMAASVT